MADETKKYLVVIIGTNLGPSTLLLKYSEIKEAPPPKPLAGPFPRRATAADFGLKKEPKRRRK
jgi:hypothetical protein